MATIRLKGDLDIELKSLGLKAGDEISAVPDKWSKVGAMNFTRSRSGCICDCVVWPVNYDIVSGNSDSKSRKELQMMTRINVRAELIDSIIFNAIKYFGGPGNATVSQPSFRVYAGVRANYLVHGLDQYRVR